MAFFVEIKVYPRSSKEKIIESDEILKVYVKKAPDKGKANKDVIKLISKRYKVKKSDIRIIRGKTSRNKLLEVND
jgi:hypothetical protein